MDNLAQLQVDVAVILSTCQDIKEDVSEVKSSVKDHGVRIGQLEVSQKGLEVKLQSEMRNRGIVSIVIAAIAAWLSGTFGSR